MPTLVEPFRPRSIVSEEPDGLRISIPPKRSLILLFFVFWLCGWTVAGISTGRSLFGHFSFFVFFWMFGWAFGEIAVSYIILYALGGREIILANSETLTCRTEIFGIGIAKAYLVRESRNLRFQRETGTGKGRTSSRIAFDYGAKTITFGADLDEAEAAELITRIRQRSGISDLPKPLEPGIKVWGK